MGWFGESEKEKKTRLAAEAAAKNSHKIGFFESIFGGLFEPQRRHLDQTHRIQPGSSLSDEQQEDLARIARQFGKKSEWWDL